MSGSWSGAGRKSATERQGWQGGGVAGGGWRLLGMGITRKLQSAQHSAVWTIRAVVVMTEESGALPGGSRTDCKASSEFRVELAKRELHNAEENSLLGSGAWTGTAARNSFIGILGSPSGTNVFWDLFSGNECLSAFLVGRREQLTTSPLG